MYAITILWWQFPHTFPALFPVFHNWTLCDHKPLRSLLCMWKCAHVWLCQHSWPHNNCALTPLTTASFVRS